jgi:hypothetical protein
MDSGLLTQDPNRITNMSPEELHFFTEGRTDMTMEQPCLVPLTHDNNAVPDRAPRPQLHRYILKEGEVEDQVNYLYPVETNPRNLSRIFQRWNRRHPKVQGTQGTELLWFEGCFYKISSMGSGLKFMCIQRNVQKTQGTELLWIKGCFYKISSMDSGLKFISIQPNFLGTVRYRISMA